MLQVRGLQTVISRAVGFWQRGSWSYTVYSLRSQSSSLTLLCLELPSLNYVICWMYVQSVIKSNLLAKKLLETVWVAAESGWGYQRLWSTTGAQANFPPLGTKWV